MRLVILGASGRTGQEVIRQAVARGHKVTAVVRNPGKIADKSGINVVSADVTDANALIGIFNGQDAIISALGNNNAKLQLIEKSSRAIIQAMQTSGVKRLLVELSFAGADDATLSKPFQLITKTVIGKMLIDQSKGAEQIKASKLDWTVVYATILTNGSLTKKVRVLGKDEKIGMKHKISRSDVAYFMLEAVEGGTYIDELPVISN